MRQQRAALLGEFDAAGQPVEEVGVQVPFEDGDLPRDGRLGVAEQAGGVGERLAAGDRHEHLKTVDLHAAMLEPHGYAAEHSLVTWLGAV
jgi:hypothetical protein